MKRFALENAGVFRKEAENHPVKKVGHGGRVKATFAQGGGNFRKVPGGLLCDGGTGAAGAECFRVVEDGAHDFDVAGFSETFQWYLMGG